MNEWVVLVGEDCEQTPRNGNACWEITLGAGEGIRGRGSFKEEQAQEDEDLGENAGLLGGRVDAKRLESGKNNQNSRPSVIKREGKVNPKFVI